MSATNPNSGDSPRGELQATFRASGAFDALRAEVSQLRGELAAAHAGRTQLAGRLSALVDSLPGGVLVLGAHGRVLEVNPAATEMLGGPLLGEALAAVVERSAVNAAGTRAVCTGAAGTRAAGTGAASTGAAGTGGAEHLELRSGRFVNMSRRPMAQGGEVVLLADVTESHLTHVFLARQQRLLMLGELAAGLAHQIRTPLATALLYASQMTSSERSREKTVGSLKQLDRLVTDMLAFAHGGAVRETVDVAALLEQVAQWLRPALRSGVRLTIRTQAPDLKVRANAPSLVSVVLNLATNALQAAAGDLELELLARRGDRGRAQIVVTDNGPGIPAHLQGRIFEPFFTTRERGNGIGLSIVKSVVEAHGGSVRLQETGPGATFVIDLPAEEIA